MFITSKKHEKIIKDFLKREKELNKRILVLEKENRIIKNEYKESLDLLNDYLAQEDLIEENEKLSTKISILETFISFEYNKEINRLEHIKRRTKKSRVKKKCESRILDYKSRLLAFER